MSSSPSQAVAATSQLWSDKYRPQTIAEMCYPVAANRLRAWLEAFVPADNNNSSSSSKKSEAKRPRGALLSGPPGVGKTTTVYVVARELGYSVVEYNASDFRSRKSLREHVRDMTTNTAFARNSNHNHHNHNNSVDDGHGRRRSDRVAYAKALLLMDEVDGCDVGGVGEVIEMLKQTHVPVVCTCNDRWHPKLRSLLNYVEDIRCIRPPCNLVANYLCDRVLAREGVTVSKPLLQDIIKRAGSDVRNMLNSLQLWCLHRSSLEQRQLARCAVQSSKDGDVGLFDAAEYMLMQGTTHGERHSIAEMQTCYYSADLVDLFVQENYLHFNPAAAAAAAATHDNDNSNNNSTDDSFYHRSARQREWMAAVSAAASCISRGDAVQRLMYGEQNWSASRAHVLLSAIAPCVYTRGRYESFATGQQVFFDRQRPVKFPSWLGHHSSANKYQRLLRVLAVQASAAHATVTTSATTSATAAQTVTRRGISGTQSDVVCDYVPLGWELPLTQPLATRQKDGIDDVMRVMDAYALMRDDWDLVQQLAHYPRMMQRRGGAAAAANAHATSSFGATVAATAAAIPSAVKSAFTRAFRQSHGLDSFAKAVLTHTGNTQESGSNNNDDNNDGSDNDDDDDDTLAARRREAAAAAAAAAVASKSKKGSARKPACSDTTRAKKAASAATKPKTTRATKSHKTTKGGSNDDNDNDNSDNGSDTAPAKPPPPPRRRRAAAATSSSSSAAAANDTATATTRKRVATTTTRATRGGRAATATAGRARGGRGAAARKRARDASSDEDDEAASSVGSSSDSSSVSSGYDSGSDGSDGSVSVHSVSDDSDASL